MGESGEAAPGSAKAAGAPAGRLPSPGSVGVWVWGRGGAGSAWGGPTTPTGGQPPQPGPSSQCPPGRTPSLEPTVVSTHSPPIPRSCPGCPRPLSWIPPRTREAGDLRAGPVSGALGASTHTQARGTHPLSCVPTCPSSQARGPKPHKGATTSTGELWSARGPSYCIEVQLHPPC